MIPATRFLLTVTVVAVLLLPSGCATFLNDPEQMVAFNSEPDDATVAIDGITMGKTPCVLPVPRKGWDKIASFSKEGYKTVQLTMKNTLSGSVAGNILLGGIIGLGVDAISGRGGGYQRSVSVVLECGEGTIVVDPSQKTPSEKDEGEPTVKESASTAQPGEVD